MKKSKRSSRRRFLAMAGVAAAATALAPSQLIAQTARTAKASPKPQAKSSKPAASPKPADAKPDTTKPADETPPDIAAEAQSLLAVVQQRYGKHLKPKQLEAVNTELVNRVTAGRRLRAVKLKNHEEPDFTFRA